MSTRKTQIVNEKHIFTTTLSESLTRFARCAILNPMEKQGKWLSKNVGRILAERRGVLDLTQSEVADALRLQRTSISNIESGNQVLMLDVFYEFCQILKLDPADVINQAASSQEHIDEIEKIVQQVTTDDAK